MMKLLVWIIPLLLLGLILLFGGFVAVKRSIDKRKYHIHSKTGIQKTNFIVIGGIEQYIQIRGKDLSNPVIISVHGGPGNNSAPYSYYWQEELERDYTIVHWDQRGSGNTYYRNINAPAPTIDLLLSDLDELVDYICAEYNKNDVIILGHSWGTVLGTIYADKHPEKLSLYIGIGQFTDSWPSEQCTAEEAVRLANAAGKTNDAEKIKAQFKRLRSDQKLDMLEFLKLRQLTGKYLPSGNNTPLLSAILFSPYTTLAHFKWLLMPTFNTAKYLKTQIKLYEFLYSGSGLSMYDYIQYKVPVIIIAGASDWITPSGMAHDYFDNISALQKKFILLENYGHIPFMPGKFANELADALKEI